MTLPKNAPVGSKHLDPPPTARQIGAVLHCQNILHQAGLHWEADNLTMGVARVEWVREEHGWSLKSDAVAAGKTEAEELLTRTRAENFVKIDSLELTGKLYQWTSG